MAAELVETSRLYARVNAAIEPEWAEELGAHLVKRTYSEPHWSKKRARGDGLRAGHPVRRPAGRRPAGVLRQGRPRGRPGSCSSGTRWSTASGRPGSGSSPATGRCSRRSRSSSTGPAGATSWSTSTRCSTSTTPGSAPTWSPARTSTPGGSGPGSEDPDLLTFDPAMLVNETAADVTEQDYPDLWHEGELALPLTYQFEPGAADDGVTVDVPVATLNQVDAAPVHLAGARAARRTSSWRCSGRCPSTLRVSFVPAPEPRAGVPGRRVAGGGAAARRPRAAPARRRPGCSCPREAWDWAKVPAHLRPTFRVVGEDGAVVAQGKDLEALKAPLRPQFAEAMAEAASASGLDVTGETTWTFGTIERTFAQTRAGHEVRGFPALVDEGATVGLRVFGSEAEQDASHRRGVRRLLVLALPSPARRSPTGWPTPTSSRWPGRRTRRWRSCSRTAWPPPSTRSSTGTVWPGTRPAFDALRGRRRAAAGGRPPGRRRTTWCGCWRRGARPTGCSAGRRTCRCCRR